MSAEAPEALAAAADAVLNEDQAAELAQAVGECSDALLAFKP